MKNLLIIAVWIAVGCSTKERAASLTASSSGDSLRYARGFHITEIGSSRLVEVAYPYQGATSGYKYLLVPHGEEIPPHEASTKVIRVPVKDVVCTSTTHIPLLDYLGETDRLVGFPTTDYISSEKMRRRIDDGKVTELGVDKGLNVERLAVLKPSLLIGYVMSSDYGQFKKIESMGIPVVINAEYLEQHPLGRAEWIKFIALFFNKEKEADSVFAQIEKAYNDTKLLTASVAARPAVMSGIVYGDAWFLPGGRNYASTILKDAGCEYLWAADSSNGFLQLSFERVFERAHDADLWIGTGHLNSLAALKNTDPRYTKFKPFRDGNVYTYDARKGAKGGSEFLELGYLRPDIILKDLVKIAHPELLPDHTLYFHAKLE